MLVVTLETWRKKSQILKKKIRKLQEKIIIIIIQKYPKKSQKTKTKNVKKSEEKKRKSEKFAKYLKKITFFKKPDIFEKIFFCGKKRKNKCYPLSFPILGI